MKVGYNKWQRMLRIGRNILHKKRKENQQQYKKPGRKVFSETIIELNNHFTTKGY